MIEHKQKIIFVMAGVLIAVLALYFWKSGADIGAPVATPSDVSEVIDDTKLLKFRTTFGVYDLAQDESNATSIPGIPSSFVGIKASPDDDNNVRKLVQFAKPVMTKNRKAIEASGATIIGYYPDNILVVKTPKDNVPNLENLAGVHAVVAKPSWVSLQPNLLEAMDRMVEARAKGGLDDSLTLLLDGDSGADILKGQLSRAGFEVNKGRSDFAKIVGPVDQLKEALPRLMTVPSVSSIQLDIPKKKTDSPVDVGAMPAGIPPTAYNNNSGGIVQSGNLDETPIWDRGITGAGQIIMVCDTGTDPDHLMFNDPTLPPTVTAPYDITTLPADDSRRKIVLYVDAHGGPSNWDELFGHGSHVAGSMCGQFEEETVLSDLYDHFGLVDTNLSGFSFNGMAPDAKLVVSDIGAADGSLSFSTVEDIWSAGPALNCNLTNNSWGRGPFLFGIRLGFTYYDAEVKGYDEFAYEHPNFLILRAAGNDGEYDTEKTIGFESETKNELSVGALGNGSYDGTGLEQKASFSSEGPTQDGRYRPHVMAPGHQIVSAYGDGAITGTNKDLALASGTSMATPTTCGAVTLIRQYFTDGFYPQTMTPSSALLRAMAINSGTDLYTIGSSTNLSVEGPIPNSTQGWGRITLEKVLAFEEEARQTQVWDNVGPLTTSQSTNFSVTVLDDTEELRFTLVWTDPAASVNANPVVVNDLDMVVTSPTGIKYYGNNFSEGQSIEGEALDAINTEECVYLKVPQVGIYTVTVNGRNIPGNGDDGSDAQPFSLVVTGGIPRPADSGGSTKDQSAGSGGCSIGTDTPSSVIAMLPLLLVLCVVGVRRKSAC